MRILLISFFLVVSLVLIGCSVTPLEKRIDDIQRSENTCWKNVCDIAEARAQYNLPTKIVLAFTPGKAVGTQGWHAYWRDENGELYDTVRHYVDWDHFPPMAHPILEIEWTPGMDNQSSGNHIIIGRVHIFIPNPKGSEFRIIAGQEYVKIL